MDELKYLDLEGLEEIAVPEGLEARLSAKIDEWGEAERRRSVRIGMWRKVAVAASLALAIGVTVLLSLSQGGNPAHRDTYDNPEMARAEAEKALALLAYNLNRGRQQLELAEDAARVVNETIGKTLKQLENHE